MPLTIIAVNTKVEVRFHVPTAKWIEETTKQKLMEMVTFSGYLNFVSHYNSF